MNTDLLIILVKNPALGKAKTRLAATIGDNKALDIYKLLLQKTREETANLNADKIVYYSDFIDKNDLWTNEVFDKALQNSGDLGLRIQTAFENAFNNGYQRVCIIGSDCYDLTDQHLKSAFDALHNNDGVIGPAVDGGYYLLGMSTYTPDLFRGKNWSTDTVATDTINDFQANSMPYHTLPTLNDIDTEADLGSWADVVLNETVKR